jgi:7-carboxy-7-deazaguanine synthase
MQICEIFHSLQGESTYAGLPCIFIRLAGCNLRCSYCDTPQSWEEGVEYSIDRILEEINQYSSRLVEITGGEPLLQNDCVELMERLKKGGYTVLVETNGSCSVQPVPNSVHLIIDVKLPGSGAGDSFLTDNLQWLKTGWDELKFVVSDRIDFDYALAFIREHKLEEHTLLFSPVTDRLDPVLLTDWILQSGLSLRLNLQLHKLLSLK